MAESEGNIATGSMMEEFVSNREAAIFVWKSLVTKDQMYNNLCKMCKKTWNKLISASSRSMWLSMKRVQQLL